ncbi:MAG: hypothetical protein RJA05_1317 [Planctomycetota bacterium]|jgi:hypothetical protein
MKSALIVVGLVAAVASPAFATIRITEVMSSSGSGGTADWIEVTNYGTSAVDITGWKMDDNSFSFANSVALLGISTLGAGETVIFFEGAAGDVAGFRNFWGGLSGVQVGFYSGSGVSFGSSGDAAVLFNGSGAEASNRASFGAASSGKSFYFDTGSDTGIVSVVGTIGTQVTFATTGVPVNTGSLGTAIGVPAPGALALLAVAGIAGRRSR